MCWSLARCQYQLWCSSKCRAGGKPSTLFPPGTRRIETAIWLFFEKETPLQNLSLLDEWGWYLQQMKLQYSSWHLDATELITMIQSNTENKKPTTKSPTTKFWWYQIRTRGVLLRFCWRCSKMLYQRIVDAWTAVFCMFKWWCFGSNQKNELKSTGADVKTMVLSRKAAKW